MSVTFSKWITQNRKVKVLMGLSHILSWMEKEERIATMNGIFVSYLVLKFKWDSGAGSEKSRKRVVSDFWQIAVLAENLFYCVTIYSDDLWGSWNVNILGSFSKTTEISLINLQNSVEIIQSYLLSKLFTSIENFHFRVIRTIIVLNSTSVGKCTVTTPLPLTTAISLSL